MGLFPMNRSLFDQGGIPGPKMRNIFQQPVDFSQQQPPEEPDNYLSEIMRVTKNRPAMSDYQKQLTDMPQEADYAPTKLGRLSAGLAGVATGLRDPGEGYKTAQGIIQAPYRQAIGEFNNKLGIRKELAGIEEKSIDDQVKAMSEARAMGLNYDKFKLERSKQGFDQGLKGKEFDLTSRKTEAEIAKMQENNYEYSDQADGSIMAIDKNDPTKRMTIPAHTVKAGQLNAENMNAQSQRISANAAASNASTGVTNEKSLAIYRDVMGKAATARASNATSRLNKPQSAYQQSRAVDLSLSLLEREPQFKAYIKKGGRDDAEPYLLAPDDGSPMYKELKRQLKKRVESSLKSGTPFPEEGADNQDDDIIDLGPKRK